MAVGEEPQQRGLGRLALADRRGQRPRDRGGEIAGLRDRRQRDEPRTVGEVPRHARGHLDRQTRLADAAGTDQRDEAIPTLAHQTSQDFHVVLASKERGRRRPLARQIVGWALERPQRRKVRGQPFGDDLIQPQRATRSFRRCSPRSCSPTPLDRLTGQDPLGRLADDHLPAVRRRADPRGAVHVHPDIVPAHHPRLARVQPHPDPQRHSARPRARGQRPLRGDRRAHPSPARANTTKNASPSVRSS